MRGGILVLDSEAERVRTVRDGLELSVRSSTDEHVIVARNVVNSAGLGAVGMARRIESLAVGDHVLSLLDGSRTMSKM